MTKVIDISKHQATFNPRQAKANGIEAVILRHAYGTSADTKALGWAKSILEQGLLLGGYGFATWHYKSKNNGSLETARALMKQQVAHWIDAAQQSGCNYWFAVDQELEKNQVMGLSKGDNTALLNEACDLLKEAGLHPCIYCSVAWDFNYIRTADLRYKYWFARYVNGKADFGSADARLESLTDGKYTRWMRQMLDAGRLVGWQFASTGYGTKYGAGSPNIDRDVFYLNVDIAPVSPVQPQDEAHYIAIGPMSQGDMAAFNAKFDELQVGANCENDVLYTTVPVSTGDQVALIQMAAQLAIPISMSKNPLPEKAEEPVHKDEYSVLFMGVVLKGGFESAEEAVEYIESVLGAGAVKIFDMKVQEA